MIKKGTKLYSILKRKCPVCQEGDFFVSRTYDLKSSGKIHEKCPNCAEVYSKEPGFYQGAMYVSYGIGVTMFIAVFLLKYAFPEVFGSTTLLNVGLGTKAPLGKSDATRENGILHTADLQPGSGAWDGIGWLSASKKLGFRPSASLIASFTYRLTGKNAKYLGNSATYKFGNSIQSNLGYTDQFLISNILVNSGLIFKYRKSGKDKIDGSEIPNTGGEWVFVRPEIGVQISPSIRMDTRF